MNQRTRRRFLKNSVGAGALALWGGPTADAAEVGESLAAENSQDKIRDVELYRVKTIRMRPGAPYFVWVRIRTENGLIGFGECYTVETTLDWLKQYMKSLEGRNVSSLINRGGRG